MTVKGLDMSYILLILPILLTSCASRQKEEKVAWEAWRGHRVEEVLSHSYFRTLPLKKIQHDETETWIFRHQSKFQTDAYCQSLGGCMGMPYFNCDNAFSIKNKVVLDFEQKGSCPDLKLIKPDRK
jgi:hypothetical protein